MENLLMLAAIWARVALQHRAQRCLHSETARMRDITCVASSECPPSLKKLSSGRITRSRSSTALQMPAISSCVGVVGVARWSTSPVFLSASSPWKSILPLAVSGKRGKEEIGRRHVFRQFATQVTLQFFPQSSLSSFHAGTEAVGSSCAASKISSAGRAALIW